MRPLTDGEAEGRVPDMASMLSDYYALRGWDPYTGKPSAERLFNLGMGDIASGLNL